MWPQTPLTKKLNIPIPLIQAPMAGFDTVELAATVSESGGLGSIGLGYLSPETIKQRIHLLKKRITAPFAVNLFVPTHYQAVGTVKMNHSVQWVNSISAPLKMQLQPPHQPYQPSFEAQMQALLDEKVPIFSFTFGIPNQRWLKIFKERGVMTIGTATNVLEAVHLANSGIDMIVAQGKEAGGHRGTFLTDPMESLIPLKTLLVDIIAAVDIPIIAAGGMMNADHIRHALNLGASGVQMGTAFLTTEEADTHPLFKKKLLSLVQDETILTRAFSGRLARGLNNYFITQMETHRELILDYPIQNALTRPMREAAKQQDNLEFMSLWAGQNAFLSRGGSARELLARWAKAMGEKADV
ncbi:MAG: nitronate monooxygenase [Gammaproteobacteria bacterium]|nr:nitronate monooxygenase [Gammaproteobacteria bacterium]